MAEKRIHEYESLMNEVAEYDDYVMKQIQEWGIVKDSGRD